MVVPLEHRKLKQDLSNDLKDIAGLKFSIKSCDYFFINTYEFNANIMLDANLSNNIV